MIRRLAQLPLTSPIIHHHCLHTNSLMHGSTSVTLSPFRLGPRMCPIVGSHLFRFGTAKLTKKEVETSSYDELVAKIAKLYNFQQYKIPSSLALLEIHHQFNIFKPGQWVLDIGAGPNWSWTELALKLTHSSDIDPKVISCDLKQYKGKQKANNITVTGNFMDEPVQTKIAMHLLNRHLDVVLVDATSTFTGDQEADAYQTIQVFVEALRFSEKLLKKGGTVVFKTVESSLSLEVENQAKFFFNEVYRYKSSAFRVDSPAFFYILRGWMMTENLEGAQQFLKDYRNAKSSYAKIKVVEGYRAKYKWDPVQIIVNEAKERIVELRGEGRKNKQIASIYENDPFVKIGEILNLLDKVDDEKAHPLERSSAKKELALGKKDDDITLPKSKDQFAQMLFAQVEKAEKELEENKLNKKNKKEGIKSKKTAQKEKIEEKAPLSDNEVFMKSTKVNNSEELDLNGKNVTNYFQQDLYGFHPGHPTKSIHLRSPQSQRQANAQNETELQKIFKSFPEVKEALDKNKQTTSQQKFDNMINDDLFSQKKQAKAKTSNPKPADKVDEQEQEQEQEDNDEDDIFDSPKVKHKIEERIKNRVRNTRKAGDDLDIEFDHSAVDKHINTERQRMEREEIDQSSKIEYLKTKPKKASREVNQNRSRRDKEPSYFKTKKKDLF